MELLEMYYTDNFETFDEWYNLVKTNAEVFPRFRIPYQEWVDEYIERIEEKSESEVLKSLRYLLFPFTRNLDISSYSDFKEVYDESNDSGCSDPNRTTVLMNLKKIEKYKRIENNQEAWEGLTWILQLLPFQPYNAIRALNLYLKAEIMYMPDDRIIGIEQCISIIESKFIYTGNGLEKYILNLTPREFELLIASLYEHLGYEIEVTPATRDGGKDIIAKTKREEGKEVVYVECKLYKTTELNVNVIRALFGVISYEHINRGVIFCTGYVSEKLKKENPLIQIWTLEEIIILLNAHLGSDWFKRINLLI